MPILLVILRRFECYQWGYISKLTTENHSVLLHPINADETLGGNNVGAKFYLEGKVHSRRTLLGRATTVIGTNRVGEADSRIIEGEHAEVQRDNEDTAVRGASTKLNTGPLS